MVALVMNSNYLAKVTTLLEQACQQLASIHKLEYKNLFGAVGGYIDGTIFISSGKFGIALRLPVAILEALFKENGVTSLNYFPNGHIKREYAVLSPRILEDKHRIKELLDESIMYVCA